MSEREGSQRERGATAAVRPEGRGPGTREERALSERLTMIDVLDPATEQVIETVPQATAEDADEAIRRARDAYPAWKAVAPDDRFGGAACAV